MTQPSNVRFIMEDRFNADLNAFKDEVNADQTAFETQINTNYSNNLYTIPKTNYVLNGAFDIWQRGTSFAAKPSGSFFADRWFHSYDGTPTGLTISKVDIVPVWVNSNKNYSTAMKYETTGATTGGTYNNIVTRIEDVRTTLGGTLNLVSMGIYDDSTMYIDIDIVQNFGTGGSTSVTTSVVTNLTINKYQSGAPRMNQATLNYTLPSYAGKTIGQNSYIEIVFKLPVPDSGATNPAMQFWMTAVSLTNMTNNTSSIYSRVGGSIAGELAACQRYYQRITGTSAGAVAQGGAGTTTSATVLVPLKTTMRVTPTAIDYPTPIATHFAFYNWAGAGGSAASALALGGSSNPEVAQVTGTITGATANTAMYMRLAGNTSYIGFSAEL